MSKARTTVSLIDHFSALKDPRQTAAWIALSLAFESSRALISAMALLRAAR